MNATHYHNTEQPPKIKKIKQIWNYQWGTQMLLWHIWSLITYLNIIHNNFNYILGLSFDKGIGDIFKPGFNFYRW